MPQFREHGRLKTEAVFPLYHVVDAGIGIATRRITKLTLTKRPPSGSLFPKLLAVRVPNH